MESIPNHRIPAAHKLPQHVKEDLIRKIRASLSTKPEAVEKAIAILYHRQTSAEKATETTMVNNNLGVQHCHGRRIAYYGKWLASGRHLTDGHLDRARAIANKYAATQLFEIAAVKAGLV